jgi:Fe-S cluster assembly iron-binding protein IscA
MVQVVHFTQAAKVALRDRLGVSFVLRVALEGDDQRGYSYYLDAAADEYALDEARDIIQADDNFKIAIRHEHAPYLLGTTIDFIGKPVAGFRFDNPNVKARSNR